METSVPQARTTLPPPSLLDYFAPPTTQRCQRSQDFFPPPPVEPIVVEEPICSVEAESLQSFEVGYSLQTVPFLHVNQSPILSAISNSHVYYLLHLLAAFRIFSLHHRVAKWPNMELTYIQ